MKTLLIALSLAANLYLLVGLFAPASAPSPFSIRSSKAAVTGGASTLTGPAMAGRVAPGSVPSWAALATAAPADIAAQMRAAGFSESDIRAALAAQLNERLRQRRLELAGPMPERPYWKPPALAAVSPLLLNPAAMAELRQMARDNAKLLNDMFGPNPTDQDALATMRERLQYGALPADKIDQLKQITADYDELTTAITAAAQGIFFPEDRDKLALIRSEQDKDLRALLTPAEYEDYQLRSSPTANTMRASLREFGANEAEFRAIYQLQQAFDQQWGVNNPGPLVLGNIRDRIAAQTQLTADIKAALGPERGTDYERTTDPMYRQAAAIVSSLSLPKQAATDVWSVQKDIQQRATAIRSTPMNQAARVQQLTALRDEATGKLTTTLGGENGLNAYKQQGGQWLQNLVPTVIIQAPPARGAP